MGEPRGARARAGGGTGAAARSSRGSLFLNPQPAPAMGWRQRLEKGGGQEGGGTLEREGGEERGGDGKLVPFFLRTWTLLGFRKGEKMTGCLDAFPPAPSPPPPLVFFCGLPAWEASGLAGRRHRRRVQRRSCPARSCHRGEGGQRRADAAGGEKTWSCLLGGRQCQAGRPAASGPSVERDYPGASGGGGDAIGCEGMWLSS